MISNSQTRQNTSTQKGKFRDRSLALFPLLGIVLVALVLLPVLALLLKMPFQDLLHTLEQQQVLSTLGRTMGCAGIATLLAAGFGVPLAYLLAREEFAFKSLLEGIIDLPIVIPHTAAGIALLMVLGRQAPVGGLFGRMGISFTESLAGITAAMLFVSLPFLVSGAREAFALIDPELEFAAQTDGASRWQAFCLISLPLARRGILAGALQMWGRGMSEFGAVIILAYNPKTIPVLVYETFNGFGLKAAQPIAVLLILVALIIFTLMRLLTRSRH